MGIFRNDWQGIATGSTALTVANSDDGGGDPIDGITTGSPLTIVDAPMLSRWSQCLRTNPSSGNIREAWVDNVSAGATGFLVFYYRRLGACTATHFVAQVRSSSQVICQVYAGTSSSGTRLGVANANNSQWFEGTNTNLTINTVYRIEIRVTPDTTSTGVIEFRLYEGDSTSAVATYSASNWNLNTTQPSHIRFGRPSPASTDTQAQEIGPIRFFTGADDPGGFGHPWPTATPLDTPTGFAFTPGTDARTLAASWNAVTGAAGYQVQVEVSDGVGGWTAFDDVSTALTTLDWDDTDGVLWSTTYRARVRALAALP
jgi:hypothetical protein